LGGAVLKAPRRMAATAQFGSDGSSRLRGPSALFAARRTVHQAADLFVFEVPDALVDKFACKFQDFWEIRGWGDSDRFRIKGGL
jgi:hypothetical protein